MHQDECVGVTTFHLIIFCFLLFLGGGGRSKMHASVNCSAPQLLNGCIFVLPSHAVYIHV